MSVWCDAQPGLAERVAVTVSNLHYALLFSHRLCPSVENTKQERETERQRGREQERRRERERELERERGRHRCHTSEHYKHRQ